MIIKKDPVEKQQQQQQQQQLHYVIGKFKWLTLVLDFWCLSQ